MALMVRYLAAGREELNDAAPIDAGRLLGTVASAVVREAPCEVLVVRPPAAWGDVTEIEVPEDV